MTNGHPILDLSERRVDEESTGESDDVPTFRACPDGQRRTDRADGVGRPSGLQDTVEDDGAEELNAMFDVLKNRRRRRVLEFLTEQGGHTTLGDVAEYIAAIENDKPRELLSSQERKRVYIGLYQCHLPRMDRAGVVEFDRHRGTIEACEDIGAYRPYVSETRPYPSPSRALAHRPSTPILFGWALVAAVIVADVPGWITHGVLLACLSIVVFLAVATIAGDRRDQVVPL